MKRIICSILSIILMVGLADPERRGKPRLKSWWASILTKWMRFFFLMETQGRNIFAAIQNRLEPFGSV